VPNASVEPAGVNPSSSPRHRRRPYQKSGLYTLKRAVQTLGKRALPSRSTALGRALHDWRAGLVADLGGDEAISTQQRALIELATRTKLLLDSIDAYVLGMESPVDRRHRRLWLVVRERQGLVGQLQSILRDLGLEKRTRERDITAQLAAEAVRASPAHCEMSELSERGGGTVAGAGAGARAKKVTRIAGRRGGHWASPLGKPSGKNAVPSARFERTTPGLGMSREASPTPSLTI